ncbi:MAG TPA: hypothetical protein VNX66_00440 [Candidatus Sulfotelmatobacter sp.]|jgi:hypothetical protein|nr:hypothetical protein [Candidatus Sulfotelmatobacter sp.]
MDTKENGGGESSQERISDRQAKFLKSRKQGYIAHVVLAVIVSLMLAMALHLWSIDAPPDVRGGGMFLVVMRLGLPLLIFAFVAILNSARADWKLPVLLAAFLGVICAWTFQEWPPAIHFLAIQFLYVGLTAYFALSLLWEKRKRKQTTGVAP